VHGSKGQASLESIALTTIVVVLITSAAAFGKAPDLGDPVVRQIKRGLCIVRAGDCERDRAPCVTKSDDSSAHAHATIGFVRVDRDSGYLIEEMSDGTVRLTLLQGVSAGLEAALGWQVDLDFGKVAIGVGGELRAAVLANARAGASAVVPADRAARSIKELLKHPPKPSTIYGEGGATATIGATGVVDPVVQGDVTLKGEDALGVKRDIASGHRTFYYKRSLGFDAALGLGPEGIRPVAGLGLRESTVYGIEFDRAGKPVDFSVSGLAPLRNARDLPVELRGSSKQLLRGQGERVLATERHLDLTVPGNLEAVKAFMSVIALERAVFGQVAPIVHELNGRLDDATYDARSYATTSEHSGLNAGVAVGAKVAAGVDKEHDTARLLAALSRGPSGKWDANSFCRPQA
jgi:hypothetical protein